MTADGQPRFDDVRTAVDALFEDAQSRQPPELARPRAVDGVRFANGHLKERTLPGRVRQTAFFLPEIQVTRRDDDAWLTTVATGPRPRPKRRRNWRNGATDWSRLRAQSGYAAGSLTPEAHANTGRLARAGGGRHESLDRGDLRKVVLAQALEVELDRPAAAPDLLARLGGTYPDCHRFLVEPTAAASFLGATPERLVSSAGEPSGRRRWPVQRDGATHPPRTSGSPPNSSTARRTATAEARRRRDTGPTGTVRFDGPHRRPDRSPTRDGSAPRTPMTRTGRDEHVLSLVEALHPTPAVGGLPPDAALRTIRETEAFDRGWYAAPVGWVDAAGNGTFAVGIRSAVATEREATLFAGAGIVADSDPDREWDEVQLKYRPILDELE